MACRSYCDATATNRRVPNQLSGASIVSSEPISQAQSFWSRSCFQFRNRSWCMPVGPSPPPVPSSKSRKVRCGGDPRCGSRHSGRLPCEQAQPATAATSRCGACRRFGGSRCRRLIAGVRRGLDPCLGRNVAVPDRERWEILGVHRRVVIGTLVRRQCATVRHGVRARRVEDDSVTNASWRFDCVSARHHQPISTLERRDDFHVEETAAGIWRASSVARPSGRGRRSSAAR